MDLFQGLQSLLGDGLSGMTNNKAVGGSGGDGLAGLLNPNALGGLVNALLSNRGGGAAGGMGSMGAANGIGSLLGALMSGGGASLLGQQSAQVQNAYADVPQRTAAAPQDRAARLIRALVYAAKADGHIDEQEQAFISDQIRKLNVGPEGQALVQKAMNEPLDPNVIASGVQDGQEAMQLYVLSYALTGADQFMERSYLDGLAKALRIPADAKAAIEAKMRGGR